MMPRIIIWSSLVISIIQVSSLSLCQEEKVMSQSSKPEKIEVVNIDPGTRLEGINTFKSTLKNNSANPELVVLDIRSSHGNGYPGWQRQFKYPLRPGELKVVSEIYEVLDINSQSYLRVRLYNPKENEDFSANNLFFEKKYPYENAKEYIPPLINVFDEKQISLWREDSNPYLGRKPDEGKIKIIDLDLGQPGWGVNKYRLDVQNLTGFPLEFKLNIWTIYETSRGAVSMSQDYVLNPRENKSLEGWYLVSLDHGQLQIFLTLAGPGDSVLEQRAFEYHTAIPNQETDKILSVFHKTYPPFQHKESRHFAAYFMPGSKAEKDINSFLKHREEAFQKILNYLKIDFKEKIIFFLYPTSLTKISLTYHAGFGLAYKNTIAEEYIDGSSVDPYHELTHVVMQKIGNPPALLSEGFAVFMQERSLWKGRDVDLISSEHLGKKTLIPLNDLVGYTEIGSKASQPEVSYPEAGSFAKYLIQSCGLEKFKSLYKRLASSSSPEQIDINKRVFEELCGKPLEDIEKEWISHLIKVKK